MTPKFALSLSYDGIRLAYRASDGWRSVGTVGFDVGDLSAALADLRAKAEEIAPGDVACKLIIPNDQIRYLSIANDANNPEAATLAALDGATPYSIDELAYDTSIEGETTHIAAVAKETLAEAHSFASEHSFNPTYAVAVPEQGHFFGEPMFGDTKGQSDLVEIKGSYVAPINTPEAVVESAPKREQSSESEAQEARATLQTAEILSDKAVAPVPLIETTSDAARENSTDEAAVDENLTSDAAPSSPAIGFATRRVPKGKTPNLSGAARVAETREAASSTVSVIKPNFNITVAPVKEEDGASDSAAVLQTPAEPTGGRTIGFLSRRKPARQEQPDAAPDASSSEAQRLTVFGARKSEPVVIGGKPRFLGLILTATLLVFLAGVAAWATVFMDDGLARFFGPAEPNRTAQTPAGILPETPDTAETSIVTASLNSELSPEDAAVLGALQDPLPDPVAAQPDLNLAELEARYAVTGIWPLAPDTPQPAALVPLDDLYITSIDPMSPAQDAVALPGAETLDTDQTLSTQSAPAAAGTRYTRDDRGWVIPTPEGAITPDNVTVFLGKPPVLPPERPVRNAPTSAVDAARAALAALRPKARPADLIENTQRSTLGGITLSELGGLRPKLRPKVERTAEEEEIENQPTVAEDPTATATRLAVAASARPDTRPRNFARIVERVRKRQATEEPKPETTRVAAVAPRTVTPKIPSSASVAKEATVRNAINLGRVNLIGVTGKPSSRRALVRLANGRMKPVKVGDRIDGGRVTAIGESELRYQKGNRNLVLKMPKG